jgi:hypothetical protein
MSLTSKIAAASKRVGGRLATDKTNKEQGYQYLSADAILGAGGQALAEEGVVVFPSVIDWAINQFVTDKGKTRYDARVNYVFTVACDEEARDFVWVGLGSDYTVPDKAYYKAVTSGHKYFVAKLLNVGAFNEDGEHEDLADDIGAGITRPVMEAAPKCPKCGGPMWDNREGKKNPKAPDYKCKNKACDGAIWQGAAPAPAAQPEPAPSQTTIASQSPPAGPMTPDQLRPWLLEAAARFANDAPLPDGWRKAITGHLNKLTGSDTGRHVILSWAFGVESSNDLTNGQWHTLYTWLDIRKADDGKYYPSDLAAAEIKLAIAAVAAEPVPF